MTTKKIKPKYILYSNFMDWLPESAADTCKQCWLNGIQKIWPRGNVTDWLDARQLLSFDFYRIRPYSEYATAVERGELTEAHEDD